MHRGGRSSSLGDSPGEYEPSGTSSASDEDNVSDNVSEDYGCDIEYQVHTARLYRPSRTLLSMHRDTEPRNLLYDSGTCNLMIVDFEWAEICERRLLGPISPSVQNRERERGSWKQEEDEFVKELQDIARQVSLCAW
ncbi:hypothetical protein MKZ38_009953 [Zalerion maritima]|uniref:Protein kinase domain-containing protein n=1 Tax=Zalerion maritima TaxID=339359 RepID=A0AAD5RFW7_9PEZI|nr:hypothetical protein MKZ38_009953 [Zalerion maritima]